MMSHSAISVSQPRESLLTSLEIPASWRVLWELPFWIILACGALLPATKVPIQEWFGVPMKLTDILTLISGVFYGGALFTRILLRRPTGAATGIVLGTILLFCYGFLRLLLGPLDWEDQTGMAFALLLACSAVLQAGGVLSLYEGREVEEFLNRLVLFLSCISFIYTAESLFGLGLRSESGAAIGADFGIQRVRGPLYGASTGYLVLLPAIGWSLRDYFYTSRLRVSTIFCTVALFGALLGLGSRAALILLGIYLLGVLVHFRRMKRAVGAALSLAVISVAVGLLVYSQADTQRLTRFEDSYRRLTHETAANIIASEPLVSTLAGQGYGSIWPWYRRDTLMTDRVARGDNLTYTGFGTSLYHAHSTLLELTIEFGLPGLVWLIYLWFRIVRLPLIADGGTAWKIFTLALFATLFAFGFDLFLFKEVRVNSVWWLFVAGALKLSAFAERKA